MARLFLTWGLILAGYLCAANCDLRIIYERIDDLEPLDQGCVSTLADILNNSAARQSTVGNLMNHIQDSPANSDIKLEYFNFLFEVLDEVNGVDSIEPHIHYHYARWLFGVKRDYLSAAATFANLYETGLKITGTLDSAFLAQCISNAGISFYYGGDIDNASKYIRQAVDGKWPISPRTLANNYQILGEINALFGNVELAENYFTQSANGFLTLSGDSVDLAVFGFNSKGRLYHEFINYKLALQNYMVAYKILMRTDTSKEKIQNHILDLNNNMANCYLELEQYDEAGSIFRDLLYSYKKKENVEDYLRTTINLVNSLVVQSELAKAAVLIDLADSLLELYPVSYLKESLTNNKAQFLRKQNNFEMALSIRKNQLHVCCDLRFGELPEVDFSNFDNMRLVELYDILCYIGVIYRDQYSEGKEVQKEVLDSALQIYTLASSILDQVKLGLFDPGFSMDLGILNADLLEEVLELIRHQPSWADRIYPFFEKAKSASLLASIQSSVIESHFENQYPVIKESRLTQNQIDELEQRALINGLSSSQQDSLRQTILELKEKLIKFNQKKQEKIEEGGVANQLYDYEDLKSLQKRMNNQSAVASYFVTRTKIYIMVIEKDKVDLISRKKYPEFDADIRLLTTMKSQELDNKPTWMSANARLSELLWGKELNALPDRIVILPDGILNYLSFEMLFSQPVVEDRPWANLPYVIKSKTISYNFSASIWNEMLGKKTTGSGLLTMAPEFSLGIAAEAESRRGTVPLVFAEQEVGEIRNIWNKTNQRIPKNKSEFIDQSSRASIVHFAGHAFLNDNVAENCYLAFSSDDMVEDKLYIHEIYNMKTPCDLVVLSACNTGQGQLKKGEGVMSLARAFAYSGAKSLIYSLWEVNDGSTRKIMKRFYQELKDGAQKDDALRTAKLAYIDQAVSATQHPFFWASFVAMGDMAPVIEYNFYWLYIGLSLIVLCLVAFILLRRKH